MRHVPERADQRAQRLRRMAIQLVAQLPEGKADALEALGYAEELVEGFVYVLPPAALKPVLALVGKEKKLGA